MLPEFRNSAPLSDPRIFRWFPALCRSSLDIDLQGRWGLDSYPIIFLTFFFIFIFLSFFLILLRWHSSGSYSYHATLASLAHTRINIHDTLVPFRFISWFFSFNKGSVFRVGLLAARTDMEHVIYVLYSMLIG